jgi:hypothetical protein
MRVPYLDRPRGALTPGGDLATGPRAGFNDRVNRAMVRP